MGDLITLIDVKMSELNAPSGVEPFRIGSAKAPPFSVVRAKRAGQAAQADRGVAAVGLAVDLDAGNALDRLADVEVREAAQAVRRNAVRDLQGVALGGDGVGVGGAETGYHNGVDDAVIGRDLSGPGGRGLAGLSGRSDRERGARGQQRRPQDKSVASYGHSPPLGASDWAPLCADLSDQSGNVSMIGNATFQSVRSFWSGQNQGGKTRAVTGLSHKGLPAFTALARTGSRPRSGPDRHDNATSRADAPRLKVAWLSADWRKVRSAGDLRLRLPTAAQRLDQRHGRGLARHGGGHQGRRADRAEAWAETTSV